MISDVLSDAAHEIRQYLADYPDTYTNSHREVEKVLSGMDQLRQRFDDPTFRFSDDPLSLWVHIEVDNFFAGRDELTFRNQLQVELERRGFGDCTGAGSGCGEMDISFTVTDEQSARKMLADAFAEFAPGCKYRVSVN